MAFAMIGRLLLLFIVLFAVPVRVASATAFCETVVEPFGYGCAEFTVQTDDGFVLALHRLSRHSVSGGDNSTQSRRTPDEHVTRKLISQEALLDTDTASTTVAPNSRADYISHRSKSKSRTRFNGRTQKIHKRKALTVSKLTAPPSTAQAPHPSPAQNGTHSTPSRGIAPGPSSNNSLAAPVLLMHQEFLSGEMWFMSVDDSVNASRLLPFMLLDDGFDVWIGHQRATYWGSGHVHLKSTDREYWDWTWDQHADYDLPAQLRFISAETNQPVHVIGASQAAAVGAAGSTNHETVQMLRSLTLIGPTAYRGNTNSVLLDAWAFFFGAALDGEYYSTGYHNGAFNFTAEFPGAGNVTGTGMTGQAIGMISGPNCCLGSATIQGNNGWDGTTSFKNLLHWQQGIRTNRFARYDYGSAANNTAVYGQPTSPAYYPAQIPRRLPLLVIAGGQDWTAPPSGIQTFLRLLQKPAKLINLSRYAHYDLSFSVNRTSDVYLPILQFLGGGDFV